MSRLICPRYNLIYNHCNDYIMRYYLNTTQKYQLIGLLLALLVTSVGQNISQENNNLIDDEEYQEWDFSSSLSLSQEIEERSNDVLLISLHVWNITEPFEDGQMASTPSNIPGTDIFAFGASVIQEDNAIEHWLKQDEEQRIMWLSGDNGTEVRSTTSNIMLLLALALSSDLSFANQLISITQEEYIREKREGMRNQFSILTEIGVIYRDGSYTMIKTYGDTFLLQFIKLDTFVSSEDNRIKGPVYRDERANYPTFMCDISESPLIQFFDAVTSLVA